MSGEISGDTNRCDTELAQEALERKAKELTLQQSKESQTEETDEAEEDNVDDNAPETEGEDAPEEDEEEEEEDEGNGHFAALAKFSKEFLDILAQPNEPLPEEERKSKPLASVQKDYKEVLRLLQVGLKSHCII